MPLTDRERQALSLLKERGSLTVGLPIILSSPKAMFLKRSNVHTGVARGLWRRGLVELARPEKRGPMVMTLTQKGAAL